MERVSVDQGRRCSIPVRGLYYVPLEAQDNPEGCLGTTDPHQVATWKLPTYPPVTYSAYLPTYQPAYLTVECT